MKYFGIVALLLVSLAGRAVAQRSSGSSATIVSAEVVKGRLNPADSKPGDQLVVRLKSDLKSNGDVVLKKGAIITGIVRSVHRVDPKIDAPAREQSLIDIEWIIPSSPDTKSEDLMIALESITQVSFLARQEPDSDWEIQPASPAASRGNGLFTQQPHNAALLSMPSVVAADAQTIADLHNDLGLPEGQQLFETGHGQIVTPGGYKDAIDIFSHLNNDTLLTSHSRNFEISSGAQLQLLFGIQKK